MKMSKAMNITLIPALESDREFFRRVHHKAYRDTIESMFPWDEYEQNRFAYRDFDTRDPHIILYGDERFGVVGCQHLEDHIWFGPVFVLPAYQGKGVGSSVVKLFMERGRTANIPLKLKTLKTNIRAKELYERLGFIVSDHTDKYWFLDYLPTPFS
jgi:GNAT superfamily N-acetyltransferase